MKAGAGTYGSGSGNSVDGREMVEVVMLEAIIVIVQGESGSW